MTRRDFKPFQVGDLFAFLERRTGRQLASKAPKWQQSLAETEHMYLTVLSIAEECGVSARTVHCWMRVGALSFGQMEPVCDHLGVHPAEIFDNYTSAVVEDIALMPREVARRKGVMTYG